MADRSAGAAFAMLRLAKQVGETGGVEPVTQVFANGCLVGYLAAISTVAEIKTAFKQLPEREQWKLTVWIQETLESFETLDADGARGREPVSAVVSIVRRVKRERREACRHS
jgi:hypothetical protein